MTLPTKAAGAAAVLAASVGLALPAGALAQHGDDHGGGVAPARIASKLHSVERALDRAADKADDGDATGAATSLAAVRRSLASATTSAAKRVSTQTGPASVGAVASADDHVVEGAVGLFDGGSAGVVDAASTTLTAALDSRDGLVAAVAALDADDKGDYARVLTRIDKAVAGEVEDITESGTDDELSDAAKAAESTALTRLAATAAAVDAQLAAISGDATSDTGYPSDTGTTGATGAAGGRGDCPAGAGRAGHGGTSGDTGTDSGAVTPGTY